MGRRFWVYVAISCVFAAIVGFFTDAPTRSSSLHQPLFMRGPVDDSRTATFQPAIPDKEEGGRTYTVAKPVAPDKEEGGRTHTVAKPVTPDKEEGGRTYTVAKPVAPDKEEEEGNAPFAIELRDDEVKNGHVWRFYKGFDGNVEVEWSNIKRPLAVDTIWVRHVQQLAADGNLGDAIELAKESMDEREKSAMLAAVTIEILKQPYPVAPNVPLAPSLPPAAGKPLIDAGVPSDDAKTAAYKKWESHDQQVKQKFIAERAGDLKEVFAATQAMEATEEKAEVLEHLANAFDAVMQVEMSKKCVANASTCLTEVRKIRNSIRTRLTAKAASIGNAVLYPVWIALGAALLAIVREAFEFYTRKAAGKLAADPEFAKKLGTTLAKSQIILPDEYPSREREFGPNGDEGLMEAANHPRKAK